MAGAVNEAVLDRMIAALGHRGPDGHGKWLDPERRVAIGHTRLSIIELSERGSQPMQTPDGQVWITYNGEIYNHLEVRKELAGRYTFQGTSDTETILAAYLQWGRACVHKLNGMFAFAIWDARVGELWLARDRFGIKPLYYSLQGNKLRFASEIKAFLADSDFPRELDLDAVDAYLRLRYVAHPHTLIAGVRSLPAGHQLIWRNGNAAIDAYWTPQWGRRDRLDINEAREQLKSLLIDSVRRSLLSDVPVGVFLSGGLDSTLVTAVAAQFSSGLLRTFSVEVPGGEEDSVSAKAVAQQLGCEHHAFPCALNDFRQLPMVAGAMDQPVGDAIIVPTMMLAREARMQVKAVLTGEGADEILMGYAHQSQLLTLAKMAGILSIPGVARSLTWAIRILPARFWDTFFNYGASLGQAGVDRLLLLLSNIDSSARRYFDYVSLFSEIERERFYGPAIQALGRRVAPAGIDAGILDDASLSARQRLQKVEFAAWLPDNILTKQDNLTMMSGLEGRVPYLDHTVAEAALSWDERTFAALGSGKQILKECLSELAPALPRRSKRGFRVDISGDYQRMLVELAREALSAGSLVQRGLINRDGIEDMIGDLEKSPFVRSKQLVSLVVLEHWICAHVG